MTWLSKARLTTPATADVLLETLAYEKQRGTRKTNRCKKTKKFNVDADLQRFSALCFGVNRCYFLGDLGFPGTPSSFFPLKRMSSLAEF